MKIIPPSTTTGDWKEMAQAIIAGIEVAENTLKRISGLIGFAQERHSLTSLIETYKTALTHAGYQIEETENHDKNI